MEKESWRKQREEEEELNRIAAQFEDAENYGNENSDCNDHSENDDMFNLYETEEQKEERLAQERREKRRKRLREIKPSPSHEIQRRRIKLAVEEPSLDNLIKEEGGGEEKGAKPMKEEVSALHAENESFANDADVAHTDAQFDGQDSFDMFSTDVNKSPPAQILKSGAGAVAPATGAGIDDAEGYYRASIGETIFFTSNHMNAAASEEKNNSTISFRVQGIIV